MTTYSSLTWHPLLLMIRNPLRRALCALLGLLLLVSAHAQESGSRTVYVAGSGNSALDRHVLNLLAERLSDDITLSAIPDEQVAMVEGSPVLAIGPGAFSRVRQANRSVPILAMLVKRS